MLATPGQKCHSTKKFFQIVRRFERWETIFLNESYHNRCCSKFSRKLAKHMQRKEEAIIQDFAFRFLNPFVFVAWSIRRIEIEFSLAFYLRL